MKRCPLVQVVQETPQARKKITEFWASCSLLTLVKKRYRRGSGLRLQGSWRCFHRALFWKPSSFISFSQLFTGYEQYYSTTVLQYYNHGQFGSWFLFSKCFPSHWLWSFSSSPAVLNLAPRISCP